MSKLVEHAAYIEEDPNDPADCFAVFRVGIPKALVEMGFFEASAAAKKWHGGGSPAEWVRKWLCVNLDSDLRRWVDEKNLAPKIEEAKAISAVELAMFPPVPTMPPPPLPTEPE